ncbi:MAG: hypothetical protein IKH13_04180 [Clostridia bacterium]|nr:hypothetical protein [Clostridia bacterium]
MYSFIIVNKTRNQYWIDRFPQIYCSSEKAYKKGNETIKPVKELVPSDEFIVEVFLESERENYIEYWKDDMQFCPVDTYADWFSNNPQL